MKDSFYFPHDYTARSDEKIIKLRRKYGWEGYGLYWGLIEMLANSSEARLLISDIEDYAFEMRSECERIKDIIFNFDLFKNDQKFFWSPRLVKFFKEREKKSELAKKSAKARWYAENKGHANALRTQCEGNAIKERKGKENKVNEIVVETTPQKTTPSERMKAFLNSVKEKNDQYNSLLDMLVQKGVDRQLAEAEVQNFARYWGELTPNGKKQLWETKKTFEVDRRLTTWFMNTHKWANKNEKQEVDVSSVMF